MTARRITWPLFFARPLRASQVRALGDRALLLRARDGDAAACRELLARHAVRLHAIVRAAHPELGLADDVVQETFLRALAEVDQLRAEASTFAWLVRIALRLAIDARRRTKRELLDEAACERADGRAPAEKGLDAEDVRAVREALDGLDDYRRELVVLRYYGSFSTAELAELFDKSEVAIRKDLERARAKLKLALEEE
ncbi:RNA polymerase sigma factor [Myxococcota bacterium]|nr:RNA polymerase sigma factor [Myxococcota bacterium]